MLFGTSGCAIASATVHEAAGRIGALPSAVKPTDRTFRLHGPAFPVRCPAGDNLWLHHAIYAATAGDVLVADVSGGVSGDTQGTEFGYWGEILSVAAATCGLGGLVITGGVRDTEALSAVGFPVFSAGVCIRGTGKDPGLPGGFADEVCIGAVVVRRGDLVVGDADGVVVVPADRVEEVLRKAGDRDHAEAQIIDRIRRGERTVDIYRLP